MNELVPSLVSRLLSPGKHRGQKGCSRPIHKYSRLGGPSIPCFDESRLIFPGDNCVGSLRRASLETDVGARSAKKDSDFDRRR